jgi:hypothetical protein
MIDTPDRIFLGDQIREDGVGRVCGVYGGEARGLFWLRIRAGGGLL